MLKHVYIVTAVTIFGTRCVQIIFDTIILILKYIFVYTQIYVHTICSIHEYCKNINILYDL